MKNLFVEKMKKEGLSDIVINTFVNYYNKLINGETGKLSKNDITKPDADKIIDYNQLKSLEQNNLDKLAIIKLNGGLGTSMGLKKAKSLLPVKNNLSFLDIIT